MRGLDLSEKRALTLVSRKGDNSPVTPFGQHGDEFSVRRRTEAIQPANTPTPFALNPMPAGVELPDENLTVGGK